MAKKAFIHHSVFGEGDLLVGSRFRVLLSPDVQDPEKLCVLEIREQLPSAGHEAPSSGPGFKEGTVQQWNQERGFGFIELDDGRRLHVHHTAFGGGSMLEGGRVEAIPMADKKNPHKWTAAVVKGEGVVTAGPRRSEPTQTREAVSAAAARAMASLSPASLQASQAPSISAIDVANALSAANIQAMSAASAGAVSGYGEALNAQTLMALAQAQSNPSNTSALLASLHALHAAAGAQAQAEAAAAAVGYGIFGQVAAQAEAERTGVQLPQYAAPQFQQFATAQFAATPAPAPTPAQMSPQEAAKSESYAERLFNEARAAKKARNS